MAGQYALSILLPGRQVAHRSVIWNTNTGRLAARHCETMFWAADVFAPKCTIDGMPVNQYLQSHWVAAYGQYGYPPIGSHERS